MPRPAQAQGSLEDQLDALDRLAAEGGLYDAQDWLRRAREARKRVQEVASEAEALVHSIKSGDPARRGT